jgi:shikimate kinase
MQERVFLVGFRGVGKTTVGLRLAEKLGYDFVDTDQLICEKTGKSINTIVEENGWEVFRQFEKEALLELSASNRRVVSTGGGAVLHKDIWKLLVQNVRVVWLWADQETLVSRLMADSSTDEMRPTLTGKGVREELVEVLAEREPMYKAVSHIKIDTGGMTVDEAIAEIILKLGVPQSDKE